MGKAKTSKVLGRLRSCLNPKTIEQIAVETGFCRRFRKVRPFELLSAISVLCRGGRPSFADLRREYMRQTGETIEYKAFHNQLVKTEFEVFLRSVAALLITKLSPLANRKSGGQLSQFRDVFIQDGSAFTMNSAMSSQDASVTSAGALASSYTRP